MSVLPFRNLRNISMTKEKDKKGIGIWAEFPYPFSFM